MKKKTKSLIEAEASMERLLQNVGYKGTLKMESVNEIPDYRAKNVRYQTSDKVCSHGAKKHENKYSGSEILGIAQMIKSNSVPVRKDNPDIIIEISRMRRG